MYNADHALAKRIPNMEITPGMYLPYRLHEGLLIVSGQLPLVDGKPIFTGAVPSHATEEQAREAAELCALNILGWVRHACGGDLSRVSSCLRLGGFVVTDTGYFNAPTIVNAASAVMKELFDDYGAHARVAMGVASLPFNACVEVEAMFTISMGEADE
jgi:enamine deaminase RidA (YjgF/YER057c/UK114 family)